MTVPADPREALAPEPVCAACTSLLNDDIARSGRIDAEYTAVRHAPGKHLYAALAARQDEPSPALDVERLSIAMNRAYTYGTGTAEQVAREYAALAANPPQTREAEGAAAEFRDHETCVPHEHVEPDPERWQRAQDAALAVVGERDALAEDEQACHEDYERLADLAGDAVRTAAAIGLYFPALARDLGISDAIERARTYNSARTPEAQRDAEPPDPLDPQLLTDAINAVRRTQVGSSLAYADGFIYGETGAAVAREYERLRAGQRDAGNLADGPE